MLLIIINKNQNVNLIFYQFKSLLTPKCEAYFISLSKSSKLNPTHSTPLQVILTLKDQITNITPITHNKKNKQISKDHQKVHHQLTYQNTRKQRNR